MSTNDDWCCQICGADKKIDNNIELHVHHEKGYTNNPIFRDDVDNCITVCKKCHMWIHSKERCKYKDLKCTK